MLNCFKYVKIIRLTKNTYKGKKYVRFVGLESVDTEEELSNGEEIEAGKVYWLEVEPVDWFVDKEEDIAICKSVLFSGVPYYSEQDKKLQGSYDFESSTLKKYLDNYFTKEISIRDSKNLGINQTNEKNKTTKRKV